MKESFKELDSDKSSNRYINNLVDDANKAEKAINSMGDEVRDLNTALKKTDKNGLDDMYDNVSKLDKGLESMTDNVKDMGKQIDKAVEPAQEKLTDIIKATNKLSDANIDLGLGKNSGIGALKDANSLLDGFAGEYIKASMIGKSVGANVSESFEGVKEGIRGTTTEVGKLGDALGEIRKANEKLGDIVSDKFDKLSINLADKYNSSYMDELKKDIDYVDEKIERMGKSYNDELREASENLQKALKKLYDIDSNDFNNKDAWKDAYAEVEKCEQAWSKAYESIQSMKGPINEQVETYKKLRKQVIEIAGDEEKHVVVREKAAKALAKSKDILEKYGAELEGLPDDIFEKLTEDAKEFEKYVKLDNVVIQYKTLAKNLENLSKSIDDKTLKKAINDEFFDDTNKGARKALYGIEELADGIKEFGNEAQYYFKKVQVGEFAEEFVYSIDMMESKMDDYTRELNEAMKEYQTLMYEFGGTIAERFMNPETGEFDPKKYIEEYEKMGKPINQLTMSYQALRTQILENLKVEDARYKAEKEYYEEVRDTTDSIDERRKAEQQLQELEDRSLENKRKLVKQINEQAEAIRQLGAAAEDITRADIDDFDKVLGVQLKDLFPDDIPEQFKEFVDQIKAAFSELSDLELGSALDLFKGIAKGAFSKLPKEIKVAATSLSLLYIGLKKVYDLGKQRFLTGLTEIGGKLKSLANLMQSFGREALMAFETVSETNIDLSSLMSIGPEFEYQMQKVASIAGSTDKQLEELTATAERLGGSTQYTASQVGEAFQYMAMAGYSTEEMLSSIDGVLNLAIASGTDLATTSDIVTDYMTALGMEANSTGEFVDKLAATITSSNTTVELFGATMKNCGALAGSLGVSMTDLSTAIGVMANAGIKGERAGTSIKNVLTNMASPTETQAKALEKLGFTADKTGSYLVTLKDGSVDLAGTMKKLMKATAKMDETERAALLTQIAGKEAMAGLLSLVNQGEGAWNELADTIENSTSQIQYWNEGMILAGKSGKEATDLIDSMKKVFKETVSEAEALGLSTEDLSHAIAALGDDGKVTTKEVKNLLKVIESMNEATEGGKWYELGSEIDNDFTQGFDYDNTIAKITADTQGLTQAEKEELQERLKGVKTYKKAQKIATEYQKEINKQRSAHVDLTDIIERNSLANMSYVDKLKFLKEAYDELSPDDFNQYMYDLGLGESLDDVREIVGNTDFDKYIENLETIQGMSEQLAEAMDETTKASFLNLASAIENAAIGAFNSLKPTINGVSEALCDFFDTWHNGEENEFTWQGFENALHNLASRIMGYKNKIRDAIVGLFEGIDRFINGGALSDILQIGTTIIQGICDGIMKAKEDGTLDSAISGFIRRICEWIEENSDDIQEAAKAIIDSLKKGIGENKEGIKSAVEDVFGIVNTYIQGKNELFSELGATCGAEFIEGMLTGLVSDLTTKIGTTFAGIIETIGGMIADFFQLGVDIAGAIIDGIVDFLFGDTSIPDWIDNVKDYINGNKGKKTKVSSKAQDAGLLDNEEEAYDPSPIDLITSESYAAEISEAEKAGSTTAETFKKAVNEKLNNGKLSKNAADAINRALDQGEEAKKGAWKVTKGYISELQARLAAGTIDTTTFYNLIDQLTIIDKAKGKAEEGARFFYDALETSLMSGEIKPEAVDGILASLAASDAVYNNASDLGKEYIDAVRGALTLGTITPEEFNSLIFSGSLEDAAKKYAETGRIKADDVIDAKSFTNVTEVNNLMDALDDLDTKYAELTGTITDSCNKMANSTRTNLVNITNIMRNQMVNCANIVRNQFLNMTNIVRNQCLNMTKIVNNQCTNMRTAVVEKFISMKKVIRTQCTEARTALVEKFMSMAKVVNTQAWKARDNATRAFISLKKVVNTQMAEAYQSVKNYMDKIRNATNRQMTMKFKVDKTVTTTNVTKSVSQGLASTMGAISRSSAYIGAPQAASLGYAGGSGIAAGISGNGSITIETPLYLDGREVARATATYNQQELAKLSKRSNRKRGA